MKRRAERSVRLVLIAALLLTVPLFLLRDHVAYAAPAAAPVYQRGQVVHVVRAGETLYSIARRYGTTVGAIALANGIRNINRIFVGQRLIIPGASGQTPPAPRAATRRPASTGGCPDRYALLLTTEGGWQCFIADPFFFIIDERGRRGHWNAYRSQSGSPISWTRIRKYTR